VKIVRLTVGLLSIVAMSAGAQLPALATGSRLKVEMSGYRPVEGTLMSQTSDSLVIAADGARLVGIETSKVGRIKSTLGKSHSAGARKGAKIGTFIGAGFGGLLGVAIMSDDSYDYDFDKSQAPLIFGLVGAAEGAFYGVVIGAIAGAQDWKTIYRRPYSVSIAPAPDALRIAVSVRY
jgi:hypothetical protein